MDQIRQLDEQREYERDAALIWGRVIFPDRRARLDCVVLNVSDGGIKLQLAPTARLPREFSIRLSRSEPERLCRVVWRIGGEVGVEFISAFSNNVNDQAWLFALNDTRRPREIRSSVLRHPLVIS